MIRWTGGMIGAAAALWAAWYGLWAGWGFDAALAAHWSVAGEAWSALLSGRVPPTGRLLGFTAALPAALLGAPAVGGLLGMQMPKLIGGTISRVPKPRRRADTGPERSSSVLRKVGGTAALVVKIPLIIITGPLRILMLLVPRPTGTVSWTLNGTPDHGRDDPTGVTETQTIVAPPKAIPKARTVISDVSTAAVRQPETPAAKESPLPGAIEELANPEPPAERPAPGSSAGGSDLHLPDRARGVPGAASTDDEEEGLVADTYDSEVQDQADGDGGSADGAAWSEKNDEEILKAAAVYLRGRKFKLLSEVVLNDDEKDGAAMIPLLIMSSAMLYIAVARDLRHARWTVDTSTDPFTWTSSDGSGLPCPIANATMLRQRFLAQHAAELQSHGFAAGTVECLVLLVGAEGLSPQIAELAVPAKVHVVPLQDQTLDDVLGTGDENIGLEFFDAVQGASNGVKRQTAA